MKLGALSSITISEGQFVRLVCNFTAYVVNWKYRTDVDAPDDCFVCIRGNLISSYAPRYGLDGASLTIRNVSIHDAGVFECLENAGLGDIHSWQLAVYPKPTDASTTAHMESEAEMQVEMSGMDVVIHHITVTAVVSVTVVCIVFTIVALAVTMFVRRRRKQKVNNNSAVVHKSALLATEE